MYFLCKGICVYTYRCIFVLCVSILCIYVFAYVCRFCVCIDVCVYLYVHVFAFCVHMWSVYIFTRVRVCILHLCSCMCVCWMNSQKRGWRSNAVAPECGRGRRARRRWWLRPPGGGSGGSGVLRQWKRHAQLHTYVSRLQFCLLTSWALARNKHKRCFDVWCFKKKRSQIWLRLF